MSLFPDRNTNQPISHKTLCLAKQVVDSVPEGGIGFHATVTLFHNSINEHGLDLSKAYIDGRKFIFYTCFDPANTPYYLKPDKLPLHLIDILKMGAGISIGRSKSDYLLGGKFIPGGLPLLVAFSDRNKQGFKSSAHSYPTRIIPKVPTQDILGAYVLEQDEYNFGIPEKGGKWFIHRRFIDRIINDLAKKLE